MQKIKNSRGHLGGNIAASGASNGGAFNKQQTHHPKGDEIEYDENIREESK